MRDTYSQVILIICLNMLIVACSSSGGATPGQTGVDNNGADIGEIGSGETSEIDFSIPVESLDDGVGGASESGIVGGTSGDTAGTLTDGVGTTGGGSDIVGAAAVPVMQGEWATRCLESGTIYRQQTVSVFGSRMLAELSAFSDQACTVPVSLDEVIDGSTVQRNATIVPTGATRAVSLGDAIEVNFYFEEATVDNKPLTASSFPGRDAFIEKIEYDIVLVQDDVLYLGDNGLEGSEGGSAQTRPVSLNTLILYHRIP